MCPECGEEYTGRADKKFCSDYCRNTHHNNLNSSADAYMKSIVGIIKKNRRILKELNPNGKTKLHKDKLINKGFNFNYFTNIYTTKTGTQYYFCFEQGYLPLDNDWYALVVRETKYI